MEITLHELCSQDGDQLFTVGKSKIVWESCAYNSKGRIIISRVLKFGDKSGKPFLMGLRYKSRYARPNEKATIINH